MAKIFYIVFNIHTFPTAFWVISKIIWVQGFGKYYHGSFAYRDRTDVLSSEEISLRKACDPIFIFYVVRKSI